MLNNNIKILRVSFVHHIELQKFERPSYVSEDASKLSSSGDPSHDFYPNFCSACAVTVIFGHYNLSF